MEEWDFVYLQNNFECRTYRFDLSEQKLSESNPRLLNWIGSIDYSGYTREQCLRYLIDNYQLGDENRILLRLEDWVDKIRDIALQWTKEYFERLSFEQIYSNYQLILYLARKEKLRNSEAIVTINNCLIQKIQNIDDKQFYSLNSNFRKYLYLIILPENQILRSFLVRERDPNLRILLLKLFDFNSLTEEEISIFKQDKCSIVKKSFIYYRLAENIQISKQELIKLTLDKNKGVREIAAYYLKRDYQIQAYDIYQQKEGLEFYYISDYARKEDINYFFTGLTFNDKRIQLLCIKAICNINPKHLKQCNLKQLLIKNNKFRRVIIPHLNKILSIAELKNYQDVLLLNPKSAVTYLNLLAKKSYWQFIHFSLNILIEIPTEENINFIKKIYYEKNTYSQKLNPELKSNIEAKIKQLKNRKNNKIQLLCKEFEFILKNS